MKALVPTTGSVVATDIGICGERAVAGLLSRIRVGRRVKAVVHTTGYVEATDIGIGGDPVVTGMGVRSDWGRRIARRVRVGVRIRIEIVVGGVSDGAGKVVLRWRCAGEVGLGVVMRRWRLGFGPPTAVIHTLER